MTKIESFDRQNVKEIQKALDHALKAVGDHFGIEIKSGTMRFNSSQIKVTIESTVGFLARAEKAYNAEYDVSNKAITVGMKFLFNGSVHTVVDIKTNRPKYPYVVQGPQGGRWKMTEQQIRTGRA